MKLTELKSLCEKATPEPWKVREYQSGTINVEPQTRSPHCYIQLRDIHIVGPYTDSAPGRGDWKEDLDDLVQKQRHQDAAFVAAARTELPRLVSLLERAKLLLPQASSYVERYYDQEDANMSDDGYDPYLDDILRVANDLTALVKDIEGE